MDHGQEKTGTIVHCEICKKNSLRRDGWKS